MSISELNIWEQWEKSGGSCECDEEKHEHSGRCRNKLVFIMRGQSVSGGWSVKESVSPDAQKNNAKVKIYCWECLEKMNK